MAENKNQKSNRIPVRFVDEDDSPSTAEESDGGDLSSEEIGRSSAYEDEAEVKRRIERGQEEDTDEGRVRADDADVAGGPDPAETPEGREDSDEAETGSSAQSSSSTKNGDAASQPSVANSSAGPLMAELVAARAELKRLTSERVDLLESLARRQADFENYRKRQERERGETYNRLVAEVTKKLLPVLDNMRRALDAEALIEATESEEFRHFFHGVELIHKQLNGVLESMGVEPVPAVGQPFDPHVHEAVVTEQTDEFEPDTVMQEIVRGYRLGERLLRPAMVKVATR
ncbi:MAG TPA: nucleotide exchange factor GrpE [Pyrinomonadaceae bacterium]|nr:nucleotide exchange factor GrpE [Pyrinomonadaceae bacterium]